MNTAAPSLRAEQRRELVMTTLWQRMAEIFGNQWELNFGKPGGSSYGTWKAGLADYSEMQLKNGLEQCRQWDSSFIPHLGQFARLCLTKRDHGPNFTEERIQRGEKPLLEKLRHNATTPIAKRELARIEAILRGEGVETKAESYHNLGLHRRWGPL